MFDKNANDEIVVKEFPFKSKFTKDGKLYREKFGAVFTLKDKDTDGGITIVEIENPFDIARVNKAEFKWFPEGVTADFYILDNLAGDYQASLGSPNPVPNAPLTKHGHGVGIAKDNDEDVSEYDAKLIKGMKLRVVLTNTTTTTKVCCLNVVFHNEVIS